LRRELRLQVDLLGLFEVAVEDAVDEHDDAAAERDEGAVRRDGERLDQRDLVVERDVLLLAVGHEHVEAADLHG
jgi:hypothetical protein